MASLSLSLKAWPISHRKTIFVHPDELFSATVSEQTLFFFLSALLLFTSGRHISIITLIIKIVELFTLIFHAASLCAFTDL